MVMERNRAVAYALLQEPLPALEFFLRHLRKPLERRVRLGHEARDGHRDLDAALPLDFLVAVDNFLREFCDADDVLVRLGRQPHHEVELDRLPALLERRAHRVQQVVFRHVLVDDVAQTLRARFGRKRQAALSHLLQSLGDVDGETVDAQGRQGKAHTLALGIGKKSVDKRRKA